MPVIGRRAPSGRIAYVNGRYLPHGAAAVHIEDRGLQFADSIYEVCAILEGRLLEVPGHLDRLEQSLAALLMPLPMSRVALRAVMHEVVRRNRVKYGILYLQITRGAYRRDHPMPKDANPTVILTVRRLDRAAVARRRAEGIAVITRPDIRWGRCDIKSTALLPNIMAKTEAQREGAGEVWLVDPDGRITEGGATNAWIVKGGTVVTRPLSHAILAGVTRAGVLAAIRAAQIRVEQRPFTPADAYAAEEAFVTSAAGGVIPVVRIDGHAIGSGRPGPLTNRIHELYQAQTEALI
jgi:D-alanine transaminase